RIVNGRLRRVSGRVVRTRRNQLHFRGLYTYSRACMKRLKKQEHSGHHANDGQTEGREECDVDPAVMDPDVLRRRVLQAFSMLRSDEAQRLRDDLLGGLTRSGIDVGATLLLIGCPADAPDNVTPPDLAHLVRYVRINRPAALTAVWDPLTRLMMVAAGRRPARESRRAA